MFYLYASLGLKGNTGSTIHTYEDVKGLQNIQGIIVNIQKCTGIRMTTVQTSGVSLYIKQ